LVIGNYLPFTKLFFTQKIFSTIQNIAVMRGFKEDNYRDKTDTTTV